MRRIPLLAALASVAITAAACGGGAAQTPPPVPPSPSGPVPTTTPTAPTADTGTATVDDARAFLADVDKNLRRVMVAKSHAEWVYETNINGDTDFLTTGGRRGDAGVLHARHRRVEALRRVDRPRRSLARQMHLLKISPTIPAPSDAGKRKAASPRSSRG